MGCMNVPNGETIYFDAVTHNPATGALQNADSTPTWKVFNEVSDTPAVSGNMTLRSGTTGHYKGSFEASIINGFDPGEFFQVVVEATVNGVAARSVIMTFRVLAAETTVGKMSVDNAELADAVLARDVSQVEATAPEHSLATIVLAALESAISSTEWVIKQTDGTTTHVTKTVTTDEDAEPITGVS